MAAPQSVSKRRQRKQKRKRRKSQGFCGGVGSVSDRTVSSRSWVNSDANSVVNIFKSATAEVTGITSVSIHLGSTEFYEIEDINLLKSLPVRNFYSPYAASMETLPGCSQTTDILAATQTITRGKSSSGITEGDRKWNTPMWKRVVNRAGKMRVIAGCKYWQYIIELSR